MKMKLASCTGPSGALLLTTSLKNYVVIVGRANAQTEPNRGGWRPISRPFVIQPMSPCYLDYAVCEQYASRTHTALPRKNGIEGAPG
jgi:hypothetical protein